MREHTFLKTIVIALGSVAILLLFSRIIAVKAFYEYEATTYDWRVVTDIDVSDKHKRTIDEVIIVDVDEFSFKELGTFYRWPKEYWVEAINNVAAGQPSAILIDVIFDENKIDPREDSIFVEGVRKAGNVYNALYFGMEEKDKFYNKMDTEPDDLNWQDFVISAPKSLIDRYQSFDRISNTFYPLLNAGKSAGHVNFDPDVDGVIRYSPLGRRFNDKFYPSISFRAIYDILGATGLDFDEDNNEIVLQLEDGERRMPIDDKGRMLITYQGGYKIFRNISFEWAKNNKIDSTFYKDKIVIFGTSLTALFDLRVTPIDPAYPGVATHASMLYQLLKEDYTYKLGDWQSMLISILFALIFTFIFLRLKPVFGVIISVIGILAYIIVAFLVFNFESLWIPIVEPSIQIFLSFAVAFTYRYATEEKNKRFLKGVFSHYVTPSVVDELLTNPDKIKLGGERKVCTVMFSDVAGFTTISEQMEPEELVLLLNEYLTAMTNIVFKYDGMLDKYEGDAIMAVFGAPVERENDALDACYTAIEMQETLVGLREKWKSEGKPQLQARIGLNTGPMVVGNMGSESRFDYTVMGDAVNLGARLEPANKQYGTFVMMGEESYQKTKDKIVSRKLDLLRVKGKSEPIGVYEVVGRTGSVAENKLKVLDLFASGYAAYLMQKWDMAESFFAEAISVDQDDEPSKTYLKRCAMYRADPPGENWDGVFTMTTK
jgi:adenylate cyclase